MASTFIADEDVAAKVEEAEEQQGGGNDDVDSDDEQDDDSSDRATDRAIREVTALKDQGTALFKEGKFSEAVALYLQGSSLMPEIRGYREQVAREVKTACLTNAAMCCMKAKDYNACVTHCTSAIATDQRCVKAFFRRGVALKSLEKFEASKEDLKHALVLEPTNKAVKQELEATNKEEMSKKKAKSGVNDYSRFDHLDVSDDEEEEKKEKDAQPVPETKKKSPPKKASAPPSQPSKKPSKLPSAYGPREEDDEEDLMMGLKKKGNSKYWWDNSGQSGTPTSTGSITPQKIETPVTAGSDKPGSVWNQAGTWEEKEMMPFWTLRTAESLSSLVAEWGEGTVKVTEVKDLTGEATVCVRRGKVSRLFDLSMGVAFLASSPQGKNYKGTLHLPNVADDHEGEFEMGVKWEGTKPKSGGVFETTLLAALDPRCKGDKEGTLGKQITRALLALADEYQALAP